MLDLAGGNRLFFFILFCLGYACEVLQSSFLFYIFLYSFLDGENFVGYFTSFYCFFISFHFRVLFPIYIPFLVHHIYIRLRYISGSGK